MNLFHDIQYQHINIIFLDDYQMLAWIQKK